MTLDEAIRENKEDLKNFISNYEKELNKNDFDTIYWMNNTVVNRAVTALLLKSNINPLNYMDHIPANFAAGLNIEKFVIPDSITGIGYWAFEDCVNLSSIEIPKSVIIIGGNAFHNCPKLKDVYYTGSEEDWKKIKIGPYNKKLRNANIHYNS